MLTASFCDTHRRCARIRHVHIEGTLESVREMCESIIAQLDMLEEDFRFEVEEDSAREQCRSARCGSTLA